ncbi:hypothetical protein BDQ12DRAFT_677435 [Crucibulum laeve]|uniref:Diaminopimelate epimerase-like protein n=1 Tax=Crucibulum laeve TaxID=68775 RepID=A0A5C3MB24_9AGAR|nr:hypothetical protein BDQ12DRAFT_677435 [Crucibulum laeve]
MATVNFFIATAFSSRAFAGNPAAIVLIDLDTSSDILSGIAQNLNQPMTVFVSPSPRPSHDNSETIIIFGIRFFAPNGGEVPICGHGTVAAAKAMANIPGLISEKVETIEFQTLTHGSIIATKLDDGWIEILLPAPVTQDVSSDERKRLTPIMNKMFGREVAINNIAHGGKGFENYLLVELHEDERLADCVVDVDALRGNGYFVNIVTTSSSGNESFVSRMFSPEFLPAGEDSVCGSAHCLLGPYWCQKLSIPAGQEVKARQVSARGGDLRLIWHQQVGNMQLRGQAAMIGSGQLHI